jgi:hypothetical protein
MNRSDSSQLRVEKLVSWTGRERLQLVWYWLRFNVSDINYVSRRVIELRLALPAKQPTAPQVVSKKTVVVPGESDGE